MRVVTYGRVSTDEQTHGTSLDTQRERCQEFVAGQKGWTLVAHVSDDGVTSAIQPEDRPGFSQIMAMAEGGEIDLVLAADQDRVIRDAEHWLSTARVLRDRKVAIRTLDGADTSSESGLLDTIRAAIAEEEKRKIVDRTMRGKVASARNGAWLGGTPPFGFRAVRDLELRKTHLEHEPQEVACILRAIALLVDERRPIHEVARVLNEEGFRTRGRVGRSAPMEWRGHYVREFLKKATLTGRYVWVTPAGEEIPQTWPAILSAERFGDVQDALREGAWAPYSDRKVYPLSGILRSPCGTTYSGQFTNDRRYYRCKEKDHAPRCTCRMLWSDDVERLVWEALMGALTDPDVLFAAIDPIYVPASDEDTNARLEVLDEEVERIEASLVMAAVRLAHLPANVVQEATRELEAQLVMAKDRRALARRLAQDDAEATRQRAALYEMVDRASRSMRAVSPSGMQRLFRSKALGLEAVRVTQERPLALAITLRNLDPISAFADDGAVVTAAIKTAVEHATGSGGK